MVDRSIAAAAVASRSRHRSGTKLRWGLEPVPDSAGIMRDMAARAVLLTGPVGSGKTTVLYELDELLEERGEPFALLDLDWLAWARLPEGAARHVVLAENLAAVWATYRRAGLERLVAARALASRAELEAIRGALPDAELAVVRLAVPRDELVRRVRARDTGRELEEHLALLDGDEPRLEDASVDATGPPREVAFAVLAVAGW
jgi:energy-coupling factor transporter ATP-binding protein EcfA2